MFSALKKLASKNESGLPANNVPQGLQAMPRSLQRKFAKGVQYNMKIVIKGDRNVGKSCLFHRLQGTKFMEEYIPTDEIQVCSVQWNYKATDDVVKVEVWDVVDKGRKRKKTEGLKLENSLSGAGGGGGGGVPEDSEPPPLDAEFLDVYKGAHGVIVVFDLTKTWTWDYVKREMPRIPAHLPVLILGNHRDMGHHRTVTMDQMQFYVEHEVDRGVDASQVRFAESSMRNGFGLKFIHKFFNLPFLALQRETLLKQLDLNARDIESTVEELDLVRESEEFDYDKFQDRITAMRRKAAEAQAPPPGPGPSPQPPLAAANQGVNGAAVPAEIVRALPFGIGEKLAPPPAPKPPVVIPKEPIGGGMPIPQKNLLAAVPKRPESNSGDATLASSPSPLSSVPPSATASPRRSDDAPDGQRRTPSTTTTTTASASDSSPSAGKTSLFSKIFRGKQTGGGPAAVASGSGGPGSPIRGGGGGPDGADGPVTSVDDFQPEGGIEGFLDDDGDGGFALDGAGAGLDSSDDEKADNPMVAAFQDDIDSEDEATYAKPSFAAPIPAAAPLPRKPPPQPTPPPPPPETEGVQAGPASSPESASPVPAVMPNPVVVVPAAEDGGGEEEEEAEADEEQIVHQVPVNRTVSSPTPSPPREKSPRRNDDDDVEAAGDGENGEPQPQPPPPVLYTLDSADLSFLEGSVTPASSRVSSEAPSDAEKSKKKKSKSKDKEREKEKEKKKKKSEEDADASDAKPKSKRKSRHSLEAEAPKKPDRAAARNSRPAPGPGVVDVTAEERSMYDELEDFLND